MKKRIVITDSGLGGLSVLGELEYRLRSDSVFENIELFFFNSLYSRNYGYNAMKSMEEKAIVFNNALTSISQIYNPDLILIACNTLSVVYPYTKFARITRTEVKGIVESGTVLFSAKMKSKNDAKIILFGTPTTVNSGVYTQQLISAGIKKERIISQACPELETAIQNNPGGNETEKLIENFVKAGIKKSGQNFKNLFAGLCCTHYGYSQKTFYDKLKENFSGNIEILNPNNSMLDFLFEETVERFSSCKLDIKIVSQVEIRRNEIESLTNILSEKSPKTALALDNYIFQKNIFNRK